MKQGIRKNSLRIKLLVFGLLAFAGLFVAGCSKQEAATSTPSQPPAATNHFTIAGSTSVQPLSEVLVEAFTAKNPAIKIDVQGGGSSAGIQSAKSGAAQIGSSSRELTAEEKGANLQEFIIARDGIAIIVHPSNPVVDLSVEDIRRIYSGQILSWSQFGGTDKQITIITREAGSGTRGAFEELVMGKNNPIIGKALVQNSTGAVRTAVASDPLAIGYVSLASLNQDIKAIKINGIEATAASIDAGSYKLSRPFIYLTKDAPTGAVKAFIDFVLSSEGQAHVEKEGLVKFKK